jgi:hypothetical protein
VLSNADYTQCIFLALPHPLMLMLQLATNPTVSPYSSAQDDKIFIFFSLDARMLHQFSSL